MAATETLHQLTATQAAARLGVKVETVYAYVSRGVLERAPSAEGRISLFDARAIDRLARRRRGGAKTGGLSVVLGTGLTLIEQERVCYRGLDVDELARTTPFEAVAEWLWLGERRPESFADADDRLEPWLASKASLAAARNAQRTLPEGTGTADRLRAITSAVAPTDPLRHDLSPETVCGCARRLIAALVDGLPKRSPSTNPLELPESPPLEDSIASRLWSSLCEEQSTSGSVAALNAALVLIADHGLAASTLAARVAASVRADPYSIAAVGLGTLSGPLHGAASAPVHRLLTEVGRPERAVAVLGDFLRREKSVPGFGHVIYKGWDPRAITLLDLLRTMGAPQQRVDVTLRMLELLEDRTSVRPNLDWVIGSLTYASGMDEGAGEAIFGIARVAGWIAHALEEYLEPELRFRPRAHYVGPPAESDPGRARR